MPPAAAAPAPVTDSEGCPRHNAATSPREGHASTGHSQHVKTAEAVYRSQSQSYISSANQVQINGQTCWKRYLNNVAPGDNDHAASLTTASSHSLPQVTAPRYPASGTDVVPTTEKLPQTFLRVKITKLQAYRPQSACTVGLYGKCQNTSAHA